MRALDVATKFENCCTGFWLLVWKKWCLKKGIAKEIENYEPTQVNTFLEGFYAEIKNKHG